MTDNYYSSGTPLQSNPYNEHSPLPPPPPPPIPLQQVYTGGYDQQRPQTPSSVSQSQYGSYSTTSPTPVAASQPLHRLQQQQQRQQSAGYAPPQRPIGTGNISGVGSYSYTPQAASEHRFPPIFYPHSDTTVNTQQGDADSVLPIRQQLANNINNNHYGRTASPTSQITNPPLVQSPAQTPLINNANANAANMVMTPNPEPNLARTPRPRINPTAEPVMDDQIRQLYDADAAPPPEARRYDEYVAARQRRFKQVELTSGNLVVDSPVPQQLLGVIDESLKERQEFTHMRYTACTCDPNEFANEQYTLRPAIYGRHTELAVVLTSYNEDDVLFNRTFNAVMKNIQDLTNRKNSKTWGKDSWKKIVVIVVSDGRAKVHERMLLSLGLSGVYQEGLAQNTVDGEPVTAHIYEYSTVVSVNSKGELRGAKEGNVPCQVIFCLKEKNAKKINSHRWLFNAFAPILNPKVCVLLDVGTKPTDTSLYRLWAAFKKPNVAGACGEIAADLERGKNLINPLVAVQNFEYKMSNILDKPLESMFGYIPVLPGAFSAYRYEALKNSAEGVGPLASYFKGELMHTSDADSSIFEANMYLAEDRILCFELVAKRNCNYILKYVKGARAYTDVPDGLVEFISQRRRWLNGSFFVAIYATAHWYKLFNSSHSTIRMAFFMIQFIYQTISLIFSWFALGNMYLVFHFLMTGYKINAAADPFNGGGKAVYSVFNALYVLAIVLQFVLSLGNRPKGTKWVYWLCVALFSVIMTIMLYVSIFTVVKALSDPEIVGKSFTEVWSNPTFRDIVISLASTYGLYLVSSILYFSPWHMVTSFLQYMLFLPSFVNILMVYAFCNIHDVSWGTKGDTKIEPAAGSDLGHAKVEKKEGAAAVANVNIANDVADIDDAFFAMMKKMRAPPVVKPEAINIAERREDQNRQFRTWMLVAWMFTNVLLVIGLSSDTFYEMTKSSNGRIFNIYLVAVLWLTFMLSTIRFIGSTLYLFNYYTFG